MKIDDIFANGTLFAVRYKNDGENELKRLLAEWSDTIEVRNFVKKNGSDLLKSHTVEALCEMIFEEADYIDSILNELKENPARSLNDFFLPLNEGDNELIPLGKKKGKKKGFTFLRLYAIQIEDNCYLITGGAIKLSHKMKSNEDTIRAMEQLEIWRSWLRGEEVKGRMDFFEFIKSYNE